LRKPKDKDALAHLYRKQFITLMIIVQHKRIKMSGKCRNGK